MISCSLSPVSNRETLNIQIELRDEETDELIDVSDVSEVIIAIASRSASSSTPALSARLSSGQITQPELGIFECSFSADRMRSLCTGTYDIGGTLTKDGETVQFLLGTLPVLDGVIR